MHTTRPSLYCRFRIADNLKLSILLWFTNMPKRDFRQAPQRVVYSGGREPATAAMLSVIPGLGQFYNGQSVKGFLFMDVAAVNAVLLTIVLFAEPLAAGLRTILTGNHVRPNDGILQALASAHLGTPFSLVLVSMILLFAGFAARDAYDFARGEKLKPIYADSALHLSEAASGSYLFHFAAMISCAVFALFFLIPKPEVQQVTEIEFTQTPIKDVAPVKPKKFSDEASSARHREKTVAKTSPATSTASQARTQTVHEKTQAVPKQTSVSRQVAKEPPAKGEEAPAVRPIPAVRPLPSARQTAPSVNPNPLPVPAPMAMAPKTVAPTASANVAPTPTVTKSASASTPAPSLLAMLPKSLTGTAPAPMALTHSNSTSGAPRPAEARRSSSSNTAGSGPPAPVSVASGNSPTGNPTPIPGAHGASQSRSPSDQVTSPTKIPSLPPSGTGLVNPVVGPATSSTVPRVDSKGNDTESGRGKNAVDVGKAEFGPYMAELQRRIKRNWQPPKDPNSRQVVVEFTIFRSGELGSVHVSRTSGLSVNDQAAISAIRAAAPFMPLPKFADESVDIQFTFDYHVFNGHASF